MAHADQRRLDFDVVAVESHDTLSVLLDLTAPSGDPTRTRPPANLQIVLDRSGSMRGERLDAAKTAIDALTAGVRAGGAADGFERAAADLTNLLG